MTKTLKDMLHALDQCEEVIQNLDPDSKYAPGSKKSMAWHRKLTSIRADIVGEVARDDVLASLSKKNKE